MTFSSGSSRFYFRLASEVHGFEPRALCMPQAKAGTPVFLVVKTGENAVSKYLTNK